MHSPEMQRKGLESGQLSSVGQSLIDAAHSLFQQRIGKAREQGNGETTFGALHLAEEAETDMRHAVAIGTSTRQWAVSQKHRTGLSVGQTF